MASPRPAGTFRRPPLPRDDSSSSSVFVMEQVVPSFQDFIKRTPRPDPAKPLPPTPLMTRRASRSSPPRSRSPSLYRSRGSSSVYSRTVSQWAGDNISWTSTDFADEPVPPLPTLQPLAYSASTPELGEKLPTQDVLQPRIYNPLITTPSPTDSRITLESSSVRQESPGYSPMRNAFSKARKKPVQTISLGQAQANLQAPGAVHLLPEELIAQMLKKSRSHEPIRKSSVGMFSPGLPPEIPQQPTLLDHSGRHRSIALPRQVPDGVTAHVGPVNSSAARSPYVQAFRVGTGPERTMRPPESSGRPGHQSSSVTAQQERGRPRQRASRTAERQNRGPNADWKIPSETPSPGRSNTRNTTEQHRNRLPSGRSTSSHHDTDSDDSIRNQMKMVPRPLFQTKPPAKLPGAMEGSSKSFSTCAQRQGSTSGNSYSSSRRSSGSSYPFRLSGGRGSSHRRRSTSGSIPISPPSAISPAPSRPVVQQKSQSPSRRGSDAARESAFYPYIASRKGKSKSPKSKRSKVTPHIPPMPPRIAQNVEGKVRAPAIRTFSLDHYEYPRRDSSNIKPKQPLFQRFAESAAKYADLLTSPAELPERRNYEPITSATVAPGSPHLVSTQVHLPPAQNHLGWSPRTKMAFDETRASIISPRRLLGHPQTPAVPDYTHVSTPARPLDETRMGLREPESPTSRRGSIFGGILENWKDTRAEKRREELKKAIKMVPNDGYVATGLKRRSTTGFM